MHYLGGSAHCNDPSSEQTVLEGTAFVALNPGRKGVQYNEKNVKCFWLAKTTEKFPHECSLCLYFLIFIISEVLFWVMKKKQVHQETGYTLVVLIFSVNIVVI